MAEYGLTSAGFIIKPFETIRTELRTVFQDNWGTDIDMGNDSPEGNVINNFAEKLSVLWELLEALNSSFNPNTAEKAALDALCAGNGITRNPATAAAVPVIHYGNTGVSLSSGFLVRDNTLALNEYALSAGITLSLNTVADVYVSCPSPAGNTQYNIIINSVTVSYLSSPGDTATVIYTNLRELINATDSINNAVYAFIDSETSLLRIQSTDGGFTAFSVSVDSGLVITKFGTPGTYYAVNTGYLEPVANTLITIVNQTSGLVSVNNLVGGNAGTDIESDEELRVRRNKSLISQSGNNDEAIAAAVKDEVKSITYCVVKSNKTDNIDAFGRPAHSLEVIVRGGSDAEVAEAIWKYQPAGIATYGLNSYTIEDSNGDSQEILFSRPTDVYIWVQVEATHSTKEELPVEAVAAIQTNIVNWGGDNSEVYSDVLFQMLYKPIYDCQGIAAVTSLLIGKSSSPSVEPVSYSAANIVIGLRELPVWATNRISVAIS